MNWIQENKFLSGFIAVMVIGAGVLGYLLYSAWDTYSDVTEQYTEQANALHQLQIRVPYRDHANLAKYQGERDDMIDATNQLAVNLSGYVLPVVEMTPSAFQDRLRDTLSTVVAEAGQTGVALPPKFSMDFEKYETSPPPAEAAGPLGRQLAALKIVMDILISEHVETIVSLVRTPLPQEGGGAHPARAGGGFGRGGAQAPGGPATGGLVEKIPFEIRFVANQPAFQKVINDFAASSKQFFITRTLAVQNTDPKPVAKDLSAAPQPAAAQPAAGGPSLASQGSDSSGGGAYLKYIVGTEKLNVTMFIDMVSFNPPDKSIRKGAASPH